ncbi:MAG TPA: ABC transporter permease [Blastocatellia bacterium]|nr:ABC transporter permease [Blastocatellia bacterium]
MNWKEEIRKSLTGLNLSPVREADIVEEVSEHLEEVYNELILKGVQPAAAREKTLAELGESLARELARIEHRISPEPIVAGAWGANIMNSLLQDVRYGVRVLLKDRGFTLVALSMLALGIGANTAIFQLIDAVRLRSLPVQDPQGLVDVHITDMTGARGNFSTPHSAVTNAIWERIRDNQKGFSGVFAWNSTGVNLAASGEVRYASGLWVSGGFFNVLGVRPLLGRVFVPGDDRPGCGNAGTVISYSFWQREFGGDPSVIGRKFTVDSQPVEIIGVTPQSFYGLEVGKSFDVALPICSEPAIEGVSSRLASGTTWWLLVMGRLKPGWTMEAASAQLASISPEIFRVTLPPNYPPVNVKNYLGFKLAAYPGGTGLSMLRKTYSASLYLLLAIAGAVLLIACANLANLMLARANNRGREMSIRLALGASRWRLTQQLFVESLVLAVSGAGLGVLLAGRLSRALVALIGRDGNAPSIDLGLDWRVLGFAGLLAVTTCMVFGLTPALGSARRLPSEALKAGGRGTTADRRRLRLRQGLVVLQVALSLTLVAQALLFSRSLQRLMGVDPGFQPDGVLVTGIDFQRLEVPVERRNAFKHELVTRLRAIPGVEAAANTNIVPISGDAGGNSVWMDGADPGSGRGVLRAIISDGYFSTMRTPMLAGRDFNESDTDSAPRVAIVNEKFAHDLTGGANPVGRRFWIEATPVSPAAMYQIVGLVRNSKYVSLGEEFSRIVFEPQSQEANPRKTDRALIRTRGSSLEMVGSVKDAISQMAPGSLVDFSRLQTYIDDSLVGQRLLAILSGFFGLLALLLACLGLYGIVSYGVVSRTGEIGIRLALGSTRRGVVNMIMRETTGLLSIGLVLGLGLAFASGMAVRSMLYGQHGTDPLILGAAVAALVITALTAAAVPARRAGGVDPMTALRYE